MTKNELKLQINKIISYNQFYNKDLEDMKYASYRYKKEYYGHKNILDLILKIKANRIENEKVKFFNYTNAVWYYVNSSNEKLFYYLFREVLDVNFVSPSGSAYVYTKEGVYRLTDHWGRVASCNWFLPNSEIGFYYLAFCPWSDFVFQDDSVREPYYIVRSASEEAKKALEDEGLIEYDERGFMVCNTTYDVIAERLGYTDEVVLN